MAIQLQQINSEGQALQSGLDVFISVPVYSGEFLTYNNSFLLQTLSGTPDYNANSESDYDADVISNAPPTTSNSWYRYHTSGIAAPSTSTNMLSIVGVPSSHSGIYQKLSGLLTGFEYQVTINFHSVPVDSSSGTISFSRFYHTNQNLNTYIQTDVAAYTLPSKQLEFTFTASSANDIVFFDFSTTDDSAKCEISSIEIKEKNNYLLPVVTECGGNICKVLRRKFNEAIQDEV
tara:strand:+ start:263 stop:961 length:699 start_codon:yes stop_codon:yes gene_type:complete